VFGQIISTLLKYINLTTLKLLWKGLILHNFILHLQMQPSSRDCIGLYSRGWTNIRQCVTFEWIPIRPCEVSLQRNILFHWRHHSQAVHTDREYQFVYVNKQLEVLMQ